MQPQSIGNCFQTRILMTPPSVFLFTRTNVNVCSIFPDDAWHNSWWAPATASKNNGVNTITKQVRKREKSLNRYRTYSFRRSLAESIILMLVLHSAEFLYEIMQVNCSGPQTTLNKPHMGIAKLEIFAWWPKLLVDKPICIPLFNAKRKLKGFEKSSVIYKRESIWKGQFHSNKYCFPFNLIVFQMFKLTHNLALYKSIKWSLVVQYHIFLNIKQKSEKPAYYLLIYINMLDIITLISFWNTLQII